jgi:hypothetical protein
LDPLIKSQNSMILASWASDACAVEAATELRAPAPGKHVRFDDIIDALRSLDRQVRIIDDVPYRESGSRRRRRERDGGHEGSPLH